MNIALFEIEEWERKAFEGLKKDHDVRFIPGPLDHDNVDQYGDSEIVSTFIYSELNAEVLNRLKNLKLIATRSTGYEHIDMKLCKERNITVSNVPNYGENTVAEHVFGLILTISHHLYEAIDRTRKGDYSLDNLRGFDLRHKTLGVIGTGIIGCCVIEIARGFDMKILAFDMKPNPEIERRRNVRYVSMDELLSESDIITLHVPGGERTRNLIGEEELAKMKTGVVLINTARGTVVEVKALLRALTEGKVAAAGLDVLPEEPAVREEAELVRSLFRKQYDLEALLSNQILSRMRNVYITPHSAFNTREALARILDVTVENICAHIAGKKLNAVS